jgi:hypothetical protein
VRLETVANSKGAKIRMKAKLLSIDDKMRLAARASAEIAAERLHAADSILEDAIRLALCDCEKCQAVRLTVAAFEQEEREVSRRERRETLKRIGFWFVVGASIALSAWAIVRMR